MLLRLAEGSHRVTILISLLSEQRMQHVIPLLQQGDAYEKLVLVASGEKGQQDRHFLRIGREIVSALAGVIPVEIHNKAVDPMSVDSCAGVIDALIEAAGGGQHVVVNISGGTKPMSIGAHQAARGHQALCLYVDTKSERIFRYQQTLTTSDSFNLRPLGVRRYLALHGKELDEERCRETALSEGEMMLGAALLEGRPASLTQLLVMRSQARQARGRDGGARLPSRNWRAFADLVEVMRAAGYMHAEGAFLQLSPQGCALLDGGWLESYVYQALKACPDFMDVQARLHLSGVENELDVACTMNAKLGIVECKSGGVRGQGMLNRLLALKQTLAGTFGSSFLVIGHNADRVAEVTQLRAVEYMTRLIGMDELAHVEEIVLACM